MEGLINFRKMLISSAYASIRLGIQVLVVQGIMSLELFSFSMSNSTQIMNRYLAAASPSPSVSASGIQSSGPIRYDGADRRIDGSLLRSGFSFLRIGKCDSIRARQLCRLRERVALDDGPTSLSLSFTLSRVYTVRPFPFLCLFWIFGYDFRHPLQSHLRRLGLSLLIFSFFRSPLLIHGASTRLSIKMAPP